MKEKVALITGGTKGIGRAIALSLASDKYSVAVCYRKSQSEALDTEQAIQQHGVRGMAVQCDVSNPQEGEAFVRKVEEAWGRIDVLINCVGPYHRVNLLEESIEGWQSMFDNNLHPVFYMSRAVAPGMQQRRWGRIINFSMANADQTVAQPQITAHYIAKVGVLVLTRSLASLLAPYEITVNAISPGFIDSGSAPEEELTSMVKRIPAGYIGKTQDVVSVARFLLSEESRYVTGANIQLSGGWGI